MADNILLKTQSYCLALRRELGYPDGTPVNHTLVFAWGGPVDSAKADALVRNTIAIGRDMVYAAWASFDRDEPASIALVLRELDTVDIMAGCFVWAADATAPLVVVNPLRREHWMLSERGHLERRPGLPAKQLGRGRRLARQRVKRTAALIDEPLRADNQYIAPGGTWVAPKPEDIRTYRRAA